MDKDILYQRLKSEIDALTAKAQSIALELGIDYIMDDFIEEAEVYVKRLFDKVFSKATINKYSRKFRKWWRSI